MSILASKDDVANVAAASSQVIKDAIGETARVLVLPAVTALSAALSEGLTAIAAELPGVGDQFSKAIVSLPAATGQAVEAALSAVDGLTLTTTITCVVSRAKRS